MQDQLPTPQEWQQAQTEMASLHQELAQKERDLVKARNLPLAFINLTEDILYVKDNADHLVVANRSMARLMNSRPDLLIGKTDTVLYPPDLAEQYIKDEQALLAGEIDHIDQDQRILDANGGLHWMHTRRVATRGDEGQITGVMCVGQDITAQKQMEEVLRRRETELQDALVIARLGNWDYDVATNNFTVNDQFLTLLHTNVEQSGGYLIPAEEYIQRYLNPEDQDHMRETFQLAIREADAQKIYQSESLQKCEDDQWVVLFTSFRIEKDELGNVVRLYGVNQDITERKQAERLNAKRAAELATVSQVATAVATILAPDEMLQTVVDLTKTSFHLYHAHIYLLNEAKDTLVLNKGAGDVGHQMVNEGRRIPLAAEKSLVARAGRTCTGVLVNDVRLDPEFLPHPLLPDTRAELAAPLVVGDALLGVMDIQSQEVGRFTQEDVNIMTTLAAQVAVSLQNARSYARAQRQAEREAQINAISARIQTTRSVEEALQVTVRELGRALGAQRASIQLEIQPPEEKSSQ